MSHSSSNNASQHVVQRKMSGRIVVPDKKEVFERTCHDLRGYVPRQHIEEILEAALRGENLTSPISEKVLETYLLNYSILSNKQNK